MDVVTQIQDHVDLLARTLANEIRHLQQRAPPISIANESPNVDARFECEQRQQFDTDEMLEIRSAKVAQYIVALSLQIDRLIDVLPADTKQEEQAAKLEELQVQSTISGKRLRESVDHAEKLLGGVREALATITEERLAACGVSTVNKKSKKQDDASDN